MSYQKNALIRFALVVSLFVLPTGLFSCSGEDPEQLFQQGIDSMTADKLDEAVIWFKKALFLAIQFETTGVSEWSVICNCNLSWIIEITYF